MTESDSPTSRLDLVVLAGGLSAERDVSLRSGGRVAEALRDHGHSVTVRDVDAGLIPALMDLEPDCVVPVLHGAAGEDGALRDVLESMRLPYVGSPPDSSRLAFDKPVAKTLAQRAGLSTPRFMALPHSAFRELGAAAVLTGIIDELQLPLVVKPTKGGSSLGTAIVHESHEMPPAMVGSFAYGDVALIEQYVTGTEVAVSIIDDGSGPRAMPLVEIVPDGGLYNYNARYTAGATEFFVPARVSQDVRTLAKDQAIAIHNALGLRHYSRVDMIIDSAGTPWFLEVNVAPGLTETSLLPQSLNAAGTDLGTVMDSLVRVAVAAGR